MLVQRSTFKAKQGRWEELVALAKTGGDVASPPHAWRLYSSNIGPHSVVALEFEFESLGEYETYWAEWGASPERPAFIEKWNELTETGGTTEIWDLEA